MPASARCKPIKRTHQASRVVGGKHMAYPFAEGILLKRRLHNCRTFLFRGTTPPILALRVWQSKVLKGGFLPDCTYLEFRTFAELGVADDCLFQSLVRNFFQRRRLFLDLAKPLQNAENAGMIN